jgi:aminoglycoside 3-N-acetyltransferase
MRKSSVDYADALAAFREVGITPGSTLIFHSSIKSIGWVDGGAQAIADALLDAVGREEGTLVSPTFTLARPAEEIPVLDPAVDGCDTGAINAAVMRYPTARRTAAMSHSMAVVGRHQAEICDIPPEKCPIGSAGAFGKLMELDAWILLLGVAYTHCTAGHFAEYLCDVPFRTRVYAPAQIREGDGTLRRTTLELYGPKAGVEYPVRDFNRAGKMLEESGRVTVATLGNAVLRLFRMRDFVSLIQEYWAQGDYILSPVPGQTEKTVLRDGCLQEIHFKDALGNPAHTVRSVVTIREA